MPINMFQAYVVYNKYYYLRKSPNFAKGYSHIKFSFQDVGFFKNPFVLVSYTPFSGQRSCERSDSA